MNDIRGLKPRRWCVFISGRGSNLAAAIEGVLESGPHAIELVIATSEAAAGCAKARRAGLPVLTAPRTESGKIDWDELSAVLNRRRIDNIFLLGFMNIVPAKFVAVWSDQIVNLHPSLLPAYPGLNSIARAFSAGDEVGASIHLVVPEVDAGKVLKQRRTIEARPSNSETPIPLSYVDFRVHLDEQRLVKDMVQRPYSATCPERATHE